MIERILEVEMGAYGCCIIHNIIVVKNIEKAAN